MLKAKLLLFLIIGARLIGAINEISAANDAFTLDLYKEMSKLYPGDFMVSPTSIELIFGLIIANQEEDVANRLVKVLHLPEHTEDRLNIYNLFLDFIFTNPNLRIANKIFLENVEVLTVQFRDLAEHIFLVDIEEMEFADAEQAAFNINTWIARITDNDLKNIISDIEIYENSTILLNVMHFSGEWVHPFDPTQTQNDIFHLNSTHHTEVKMMNQVNTLRFYTDPKMRVKFLELPYFGYDMTVTIALPYDVDGFSELEQHIADILKMELPYEDVNVDASIPTFITETKIDVKTIIDNLATEDNFECGFPTLNSIKILQKSIVEFDERGSFADTTTADKSHSVAASDVDPLYTNLFKAHHPFIYYIKSGNLLLYIGRYTGAQNVNIYET